MLSSGESINDKIIYEWITPFVGVNPQTSARDIGLVVSPLFAGIVAIMTAAVVVKKRRKA